MIIKMFSIKKKKVLTRVIVLLLFLIVVIIAVQHITETLTMEVKITKSFLKTQIITCHYDNDQLNILPIAGDIVPPPDSIFFHETSCRGGLNSRQACSIESAARLHPHRNVYVFFNSPISEADLKTGCLSTLVSYKNVKLARLHNNKYAKGTPLDDFLSSNLNVWSDYPVVNTAEVLKFVTLYKYGGVYLDTDMLLVKPLDALGKNWVARQDKTSVNTAAIAIGLNNVGHHLAASVMENIIDYFHIEEWSQDGPRIFTQSLVEICETNKVPLMSASTCRGFQVYDSKMFYPFYHDSTTYFLTGSTNLSNVSASDSQSFGYHLWNQFSSTVRVKMGSPYEILAKKHCPLIRERFGVNFGADIEYWHRPASEESSAENN